MGYWLRVHKQAVRKTRSVLYIDSRERLWIAIIVAILAILGLAIYGSKDAAIEEIIVRFAAATAIILSFPVIYAIRFVSVPPLFDKIQQEKIEQLEGERKPLLFMQFEDKQSYVDRVRVDDTTDATVYRIQVGNRSETTSIDEVRCVVKEISQWNHAYPNARLHPLHGPPAFELAAGGKHFVNFLWVPDTWDTMKILYRSSGLNSSIPKRNFKFLIEAQGKNIPTQGKWFDFTVDEHGKTSLKESE